MYRSIISSLALTALLAVGCDDTKNAVDAAKDKANAAASTATDAAKSAADSAKSAADSAKDSAAGAVDAAKDKAAGAVDAAKDKAAGAMDAVKEAATKQATDLYDKAMAAVKENKITDAEGILNQLTALKDKLPADWASKIDSLKSAIDKAKALMPK